MKKELSNRFEQMISSMMEVAHEFITKESGVDIMTKAYVSRDGSNVLMTKRESESDCLIIFKVNTDELVMNEEWFIIEDEIINYDTRELITPETLSDKILDYYNKAY
jgi:hypothetical protein